MSKKSKLVFMIVAGLVLAAIGVFASMMLIQRFQGSQAPQEAEVEIIKTDLVILTRDLALGDRIEDGDVELASVPAELAPRNAVTTLEGAVGKMIKTDLIQGEMLLANNLADPTNTNQDLSYEILGDNHVLMAFPAEDLMSRESMIQRGDIVDIFATFEEEIPPVGGTAAPEEGSEEPEEPETRTFTVNTMQKVGVTAMVLDVIEEEGGGDGGGGIMGGEAEEASANPQTRIKAYLLALEPQDALILKHLKDVGAIFDIVLRSPTSTIDHELTPVTEEFIIEYFGLEILP